MRRSLLVVLTACAGMAPAAPAMAEGFYGGPFAMVGFTKHGDYDRRPLTPLPVSGETDNMGVSGGGGLWAGYDFDGFSLELAGAYRARHDANFTFADISTGNSNFGAKANVQTADFILSGLFDLPFGWAVTPYVGGGAGMAYHRLDSELLRATITDVPNSTSWEFAWQLQGGLKYPLSDSAQLRFDYRYVDLGRITTATLPTGTNDRLSAELESHDLRIGMSWNF